MYESFDDLTTVRKQHMVEWFCGNDLNTDRWNKNDVRGGAGTFAMADEEDGGFKITTGSSANSESRIDFNDIRSFNHDGCVMIFVQKRNAGSTGQSMSGLRDNLTVSDGNACFIVNSVETGDAYYRFFTQQDGSGYSTNFSQGRDENWHTFKINIDSSSVCTGYVDGVLGATQDDSGKLPNGKMQPFFGMYGNSQARSSQIRYCEVFNT